MKRIIAIILCITTVFALCGSLAACGSTKQYLTMGEWLTMVDDYFGMYESISDAPYFSNISADNPYYAAVQIAADWGVVDKNGTIDTESLLTWQEALVTLVNCSGAMSEEATDEEKIDYAISKYDQSIRKYWMKRQIEASDAVGLLNTAQTLWANKEYDHVIEEVTYNEKVKDMSNLDDYSVMDDGTVVIPLSSLSDGSGDLVGSGASGVTDASDIEEGDVYMLPNPVTGQPEAYKASEITTDGENIYITNSEEEVSIEDLTEDLFVEETFTPSMDSMIMYDGNGNVIHTGSDVANLAGKSNDDAYFAYLGGTSDAYAQNLSGSVSTTFKIPKIGEVSLTYNTTGDFNLSASFKSENLLSSSFQKSNPGVSLVATTGFEISSLKVTQDVDYGVFKGLKSASIKVDYTTKVSGGIKMSGKPVNDVFAPSDQNYSNVARNFSKSVLKNKDTGTGAKTIKLMSADVWSIGVCRVCLDINLVISVDGSVTVTVTEHGSKGLEYKKDSGLRVIKDVNKDVDLSLSGKAEITFGVGPGLYVVGLKEQILGFQLRAGVGVELKFTLHLADSENHELMEYGADKGASEVFDLIKETTFDTDALQIKEYAESLGCTYSRTGMVQLHHDYCFDGKIYFILKLELTDTSYAAKLLGGKITTSWEIFGSKNGKLAGIHCDNGEWQFGWGNNGVECTLKYTPFDGAEDEEDEQTDDQNTVNDGTLVQSDMIIVGETRVSVDEGATYSIPIQGLPKGYSLSDLTYYTNNSKIAKVNSSGVITGVNEGSVMITVATKDNKFKSFIAVSVFSNEKIDFKGLSSCLTGASLEV